MDKPTRQAISDTLHFLSGLELRSLFQSEALSREASDFTLYGFPVTVSRITVTARGARKDAPSTDHDMLGRALGTLAEGQSERFFLEDDTLCILHAPAGQPEAFLVHLPPDAVAHFLAASFPGRHITPAQQRLLVLLLCGMSLIDTAKRDTRSIETQKSHARELRMQFDAPTTHDVVRIITAQLVSAAADMLRSNDAVRNDIFFDYARRYLPARARALVLNGENGLFCRIYDIGPQDGRPVIALHPLILPDIRDADVDLLHELGLRLIWPLRLGQLAPRDPVVSEETQILRSNASLSLVQQVYCRSPVTLLAFAASSKLALAYAREAPDAVADIFFAAACEVKGRPQEGARRLARGLMALGEMNETLQQAVISFFARRILQSRSFPNFLRVQFEGCAADMAIVERELAPPFYGERMREALLHSLRSTRHDFAFQRNLDWDGSINPNVGLHFIHGTDDGIHPIDLIRARAATMRGAKVHEIAEAGQLLYGPHLRAVLTAVAAHSQQQAGRR